jgi:hypothetical protein
MASSAVTPLTFATLGQTAANDDEGSPFLRLALELRNRIYKYAFAATKQTGPVPHALTQTNKQIRSESRAMYYGSVQCLEIYVRNLSQVGCTRKWLAEEDWSLYPVLPNIVFRFYIQALRSNVTFFMTRQKLVPTEELSLRLSHLHPTLGGVNHQTKLEQATEGAYAACLGFDPTEISLEESVSDNFIKAIEENATWNVRRLEYHCPNDKDLLHDDPVIFTMFLKLARLKQGSEWTKHDLSHIVQWVGRCSRFRRGSPVLKTVLRSGKLRK